MLGRKLLLGWGPAGRGGADGSSARIGARLGGAGGRGRGRGGGGACWARPAWCRSPSFLLEIRRK